jgi:dihydrofolate synthase/folylpolyglutamate synthase
MDLPSFLEPSTPETRFLYGLRRGKTRLGLQSTRRLLRALGSPEADMPILQVAGTNGKGSTTALSAAILQASGMRVGRFTSPHLLQVEERISVDGVQIDSDTFARRVRDIRGPIERCGASFFEAMTGLAALHFRDAGVDAAVFEVGLGGRLDSTTALPAHVTVIASIGHDHEAILGHGVAAICDEKLGIVRPGVPLHVAIEQADLVQRARAHCDRLGAPFRPVSADAARVLELDLWSGMRLDLTYPQPLRVWTRLLGRHQARNTALAAAATLELASRMGRGAAIDIESGCARAFMPGRFQVLEPVGGEPIFILDVAHNPESLHATLDVAELVLRGRRVSVVLGMLRDKRFDGVVPRLPALTRHLVLTQPANERAWDVQTAETEVGAMPEATSLQVTAIADVRAALAAAWAAQPEVVLVLGSQYLLGEVVPILAEWRGVSPQALVAPPRLPDETRHAVG